MVEKRALWLQLKNYHFEHLVPQTLWEKVNEFFGNKEASTKAFASKIARKNGWKDSFAYRAVKEYKKFVFLGIISDFQVTPSKVIDIVWHEHLLFTKAYREFCADVIHHSFDHHPELIPISEQTSVFNAQYVDTLFLYKREFGIEPPSDIWSIPKFDPSTILPGSYEKSKKKREEWGESTATGSDMPLIGFFDTDFQSDSSGFPEFGGGDFGGGGAGDSWTNDGSDNSDSGDSSCSSCSSGCGGGD